MVNIGATTNFWQTNFNFNDRVFSRWCINIYHNELAYLRANSSLKDGWKKISLFSTRIFPNKSQFNCTSRARISYIPFITYYLVVHGNHHIITLQCWKILHRIWKFHSYLPWISFTFNNIVKNYKCTRVIWKVLSLT